MYLVLNYVRFFFFFFHPRTSGREHCFRTNFEKCFFPNRTRIDKIVQRDGKRGRVRIRTPKGADRARLVKNEYMEINALCKLVKC